MLGYLTMPAFLTQLVQRINSIYNAKRGKKRLKKLSMSSIETASLRGRPWYSNWFKCLGPLGIRNRERHGLASAYPSVGPSGDPTAF